MIELYIALSMFCANMRTEPYDSEPKKCQKFMVTCALSKTGITHERYDRCVQEWVMKK